MVLYCQEHQPLHALQVCLLGLSHHLFLADREVLKVQLDLVVQVVQTVQIHQGGLDNHEVQSVQKGQMVQEGQEDQEDQALLDPPFDFRQI